MEDDLGPVWGTIVLIIQGNPEASVSKVCMKTWSQVENLNIKHIMYAPLGYELSLISV